jgi:hypothetical protein
MNEFHCSPTEEDLKTPTVSNLTKPSKQVRSTRKKKKKKINLH